MSTDLYIIAGHNFSRTEIKEMPDLLNAYSRATAGLLRLRFRHSLCGELKEQGDGWTWEPDTDSEWTLDYQRDAGVLVSSECGAWDWKPEKDGDFEQWFHQESDRGYLRMTSSLSSSLHVGLRCVVLSPPIRWRDSFNPIVQTDLRSYAHFLTGFFGGGSVVYVPDDIDPGCEAYCKVNEGWSFDQITDWLQSQMAAATTISTQELIEAIYFRGMKGFQAHGYYIDEFLNANAARLEL